jgi:hypothetical protein
MRISAQRAASLCLFFFLCLSAFGAKAASPADAMFSDKPLIVIRFRDASMQYRHILDKTLSVAASSRDDLLFVVRGTAAEAVPETQRFVRERVDEAAQILGSLGVPSERIQTVYDADSAVSVPQLRIYVQ